MNGADLPLWATIPASVLLVLSGLLTVTGSLGLLRLPTFFARMHGPSMGNTLGTGGVLISSMLISSALLGRPVLHEILITVFIVVASPVTAMLVMRAAMYRTRVNEERRKRQQQMESAQVRQSGDEHA